MDKSFMEEAIKEAREGINAGHGGPFGAVIVKDGKIIARGHNRVVKDNDPTCHGEMMAIREACKTLGTFDLSGCEIYTTGYPCPMCFGAILWANISKIYYGCNVIDTERIGFRDSKFYEESKNKDSSSFLEECGREECLRLYDEYMAIENKTEY